MRKLLSRLPIDSFIALLLTMVALATLLPARGLGAVLAGHGVTLAIALLFFLYGARLSPQAALAGARNGKLHLLVFLSTFALFPALGLGARALFPHLLTPELWNGVILLCVLPSTVQSSIAFTSIARGNVPAALCAATLSNLVGILLTPVLAGLLLSTGHGGISAHAVGDIVLQLLLPFAAGQALRPWIGAWVARNRGMLSLVDRGSILLATMRDYDALARERPAFHGPTFCADGGRRRIVHQVWDWTDERHYTMHLYITCETAAGWENHHFSSAFHAVPRAIVSGALEEAGFTAVRWMEPGESGYYQPIVLARLDAEWRTLQRAAVGFSPRSGGHPKMSS